MNYRLKNPALVPPEPGYEYVQPETGARFNGGSVADTVIMVVRHRAGNGLPRTEPAEVEADVHNQICQRLGGEWCDHMTNWSFPTDWDTVREGTKSLTSWALTALTGESPYVDASEAERRAEICSKCFMNQKARTCLSCGFGDLVRGLISSTSGPDGTRYDAAIHVCTVCGCLLTKKVHLKKEVINRWASDKQRHAYDEIPNCWMKD